MLMHTHRHSHELSCVPCQHALRLMMALVLGGSVRRYFSVHTSCAGRVHGVFAVHGAPVHEAVVHAFPACAAAFRGTGLSLSPGCQAPDERARLQHTPLLRRRHGGQWCLHLAATGDN